MRVPLARTLRHLDRHLLLSHPVLWIMRFHWMIYLWLFGLVLISLVALAWPVSFRTVKSLNIYFWAALVLAGLAIGPWVYLQARFAPQLRQNYQARTAVYLLAGYLVIFGIYLTWPFVFVRILEEKISRKASESDLREDALSAAAIRNELLLNDLSYEQSQKLPIPPELRGRILRLQARYQPDQYGRKLENWNDASLYSLILKEIILNQLALKKLYLREETSDVHEDPRQYEDWTLIILGTIILLPTLLLRAFQATDAKSLSAAISFGIAVLIVLVPFSYGFNLRAFGALLLVISAGGCAAFRAPRLRQKSLLVATGMNIFFLVLAWAPLLLRIFGRKSDSFSSLFSDETLESQLETALFFLGFALLFALTPWIQRRYIALLAKPA